MHSVHRLTTGAWCVVYEEEGDRAKYAYDVDFGQKATADLFAAYKDAFVEKPPFDHETEVQMVGKFMERFPTAEPHTSVLRQLPIWIETGTIGCGLCTAPIQPTAGYWVSKAFGVVCDHCWPKVGELCAECQGPFKDVPHHEGRDGNMICCKCAKRQGQDCPVEEP